MQRRRFGPSEQLVPVIGQGTWQMETDHRKSAVAALKKGIELGLTHIDTAELYGEGVVEDIVAEAIAGQRERVFLASKVTPSHSTYSGVVLACEKSLARLKTDHLDLYMLHWPGEIPLEETFRAFATLREEGKIRAWGVSNFDASDLDHAIELVGEGQISCNQVLYHLMERDAEHVVLPYCERHHIAVVGYSPFGSGAFPSPGTEQRRLLEDVGRAHDVSAHAVALRFLVRRPSLFTIPKAAYPAHVEANAEAGDLALTDDEMTKISDAFPVGEPKSQLPYI